jgi:Ca-activated chloride channel homolog
VLIAALARPEATVTTAHREGTVVLAFDSSGSMAADDIAPSRIAAAKAAARAFVTRQPANIKVGVVTFGESGLVTQRPTTDRAGVLAAIDRLAPSGGTSLGRGIQTSLSAIVGKAVQLDPASGSVEAQGQNLGYFGSASVILLSDGENTSGPDPVVVAQLSSTVGVRIYPIGLGSAQGTVIRVGGFEVATALDEPLLRQLATTTDGQYFAAPDAQSLARVYDSINPTWVIEGRRTEITAALAGAAALMLLAGAAISIARSGRVI